MKVEDATKEERWHQATDEPTVAKSMTGMLRGTKKAMPTVPTSSRIWNPGSRKEHVVFRG